MRWPLWRPATEQRSMSYTDTAVGALLTQANGLHVDPLAIGAVETAAGFYGRAFAAAEPSAFAETITPAILCTIGRELIRRGECLYLIDVVDGRPTLEPAAAWDIQGIGPSPSGWTYRLQLNGPSGTQEVIRPAAGVLHPRANCEPRTPWRGQSPLAAASETAQLAAWLEQRLREETSAPVGQLIPVPASLGDEVDTVDDPLAGLRQDLAHLSGGIALVEDMSSGWGSQAERRPPQSQWQSKRLGGHPPETLIALRENVQLAILQMCGVPPGLVSQNSSVPREAWRQFLYGSVSPLAAVVLGELRSKLDPSLDLDFTSLQASDVTGRARAFGSLVAGGVDEGEAMRLAGLA